jgi:hypothetical protein
MLTYSYAGVNTDKVGEKEEVKEKKKVKIYGQISTKTLQDLVKGDRNRPDIAYLLEQVPIGCNYLSLIPVPLLNNKPIINVRNRTGFHESRMKLKHHIDIMNLLQVCFPESKSKAMIILLS